MNDMTWSKMEKKVAKRAFDEAYDKECRTLAENVRDMAGKIEGPKDIWRLHGFLSKTRREIDDRYDYRYSVLIFVFARLVREGWLEESDLEGLAEDKLAKINLLVEM